MKHFTDQEIKDAINRAPKPIQDEISSGEDTAVVIAQIGQKYQLHIDQVGTLAELNRNMLLGLVGPEEFLKELITAGIPDKEARDIMTAINQKIFVPLREQMRKGPVNAPEQVKPSAPTPVAKIQIPQQRPAAPVMPKPTMGVPTYAPPLQSPRYSYPENLIPTQPTQPQYQSISKIAPLPPKNVLPRPSSVPAAGGSRPVSGQVPKPIDASRMLEDHEEPHIEFNKTPPAPGVPVREKRVETPLGQALRTVMPSMPPTNLPGVMPKSIAPGARYSSYTVTPKASPATPSMPPKPIPPVTPPAAPTKPYSADPYREPIE